MLAVLYAMEDEVRGVHDLMQNRLEVVHPWAAIERGTLEGAEVMLVKCGAGKVLSAMTAQSVIDLYRPDKMALCGLSGALNSDYQRGDLIIGADFIQHDITTEYFGFDPGQVPFTNYKIIPADESLLACSASLRLEDANVFQGRVVSGDQFISGERGNSIRQQFSADAVDMESAAVAFVCHLNNMPLVVARTISDRANETAAIDFGEFLPRASRHVTTFVKHLLHGA